MLAGKLGALGTAGGIMGLLSFGIASTGTVIASLSGAAATTARLFEQTNHPGADVEFMMNGEVISQVQLKAVKNKDLILEHFEKYPDIEVYATSEVAFELDGVVDSGFSNKELEASVYEFAEQFGFEDLLGKTAKGFALGTVVSLAFAAALAIREKRISKQDVRQAIQDGYFTAAFGTLVDFVINDDRFFEVLFSD